jgi:hypothetical protein
MSGNLGSRERTALHEAGHIVLLHLNGGRTVSCAIAADGSALTQAEFPLPARLSPEQLRWWSAATAYVHADRQSYPSLHAALIALPLPEGWQSALGKSVSQLLAYLWAGEIAEDMAGAAGPSTPGSEAAGLDRLRIATLETATRGGLRPGELAVSEREGTVKRLERFRGDILRIAHTLYELGELDQATIARLLAADTATVLSPLGAALGTLGLLGLGGVLLDEVADSLDWFDS